MKKIILVNKLPLIVSVLLSISALSLNAEAKTWNIPNCTEDAPGCVQNGSCAWGTTCAHCCSCKVDDSNGFGLYGWCTA